ncbi:hypothetical protein BpHYR1_033809 [Brachionus plicatilis]|uniref:Uncharacterized protein n=1 Tax=Brachionus plicatilis TaxID=10195 RepID=A0A3M7QW89_BRAPC|nr:hypothetical protein BpHYR1_033809 [Brachionus plicatilis]
MVTRCTKYPSFAQKIAKNRLKRLSADVFNFSQKKIAKIKSLELKREDKVNFKIRISQRVLSHFNPRQIPIMFAKTILNSILPLSSISLIFIEPSHSAFAMSDIIDPHALVNVSGRVVSDAPAEFFVIYPVSLVIRQAFGVIDHFSLAIPFSHVPFTIVNDRAVAALENAMSVTFSL